MYGVPTVENVGYVLKFQVLKFKRFGIWNLSIGFFYLLGFIL
jgi:hypothetical protein